MKRKILIILFWLLIAYVPFSPLPYNVKVVILVPAIFFGALFSLVLWPYKKEPKKPLNEILRLNHLSTGDRVLVIKGDHIRKTGIIQKMFEDYDWRAGVDCSFTEVLLDGKIVKFWPDWLEVVDKNQ